MKERSFAWIIGDFVFNKWTITTKKLGEKSIMGENCGEEVGISGGRVSTARVELSLCPDQERLPRRFRNGRCRRSDSEIVVYLETG